MTTISGTNRATRQKLILWQRTEDEGPNTVEVAGPGGEIRIGVGSAEGPRSGALR
jgi:hypothetical protein